MNAKAKILVVHGGGKVSYDSSEMLQYLVRGRVGDLTQIGKPKLNGLEMEK